MNGKVGAAVASEDCSIVGDMIGAIVGDIIGTFVGTEVGINVNGRVGDAVGTDGDQVVEVSSSVRDAVGSYVGN